MLHICSLVRNSVQRSRVDRGGSCVVHSEDLCSPGGADAGMKRPVYCFVSSSGLFAVTFRAPSDIWILVFPLQIRKREARTRTGHQSEQFQLMSLLFICSITPIMKKCVRSICLRLDKIDFIEPTSGRCML